ncbi:MAG TPA: hypothetical protein VLG15_12185 [Thermoanaerobaculia bacterium]|nr:hypothetical protein [Thermoanaerobaculia bacterium]
MKSRSFGNAAVAFSAVALWLATSAAFGGTTRVVRRGTGVRPASTSTSAVSYSVEVPVVTRVVGTALFRTAIDISNNTASGTTAAPVVARFQYSYNRPNLDGTVSFFRTPIQSLNLLAFDNFHTDDFVQYLGTLPGVLQPGADQSSFGTLLVTFENLPSSQGWEGTVFARTYSANPTGGGTVAIAYPASLFFESANATLVATIRDTQTAPDALRQAGSLRTNIGIRNTDVRGTGQTVSVNLEFYDVTPGNATNGQRVGSVLTLSNLQPGEVRQFNNIRAAAAIPDNVFGMLVFADIVGASASSPTIEGYVNILDGGTQDGAFFEMKCADSDGCG